MLAEILQLYPAHLFSPWSRWLFYTPLSLLKHPNPLPSFHSQLMILFPFH